MLPAIFAESRTTTTVIVRREVGQSPRVLDQKSHPRNKIAGTATRDTRANAHLRLVW